MLIRIEKGIIIFHNNGTIINFPEGNAKDYQEWLKTEESNYASLFVSDKEGVAKTVFKGIDADYILSKLYNFDQLNLEDFITNTMDSMDDDEDKQIIQDAIDRYFHKKANEYYGEKKFIQKKL